MNDLNVDSKFDLTLSAFQANLESSRRTPLRNFLDRSDLSGLTSSKQRELLVALLQLEIDFTRKSGTAVHLQEYAGQFPEISGELLDELVSLPALPNPDRGSLLPARYQLIEQIGAGGLGTVWQVRDKQMERTMAVKMLHAVRGDESTNLRLRREAMLTGALQHPGVPPIYDSGKLRSGGDFFSMKLVEGQTFGELLRSRRSDQAFLLSVFEQFAQTIAYAHAQGVVHRDLKPQNIMVGAFGEVQVMDWGMAKRLSEPSLEEPTSSARGSLQMESAMLDTAVFSQDSSIRSAAHDQTRYGDVLGTPAYMSPEQARGENDDVSQASDVFALGAILFELLAQEPLYRAQSADETLASARNAEYGSIAGRLGERGVDVPLVELCTRCLQPQSQNRPNSAAVVAAVADYQAGVQRRLKEAEIERNAVVIQSREQKKRSRVFTWMLAGIVLVSLLGTAGIAWQWKKAVNAARLAEREAETRRDVNDFLILDMLRLADPDEEPDRDLKLRTVLDRAAEKIPLRFADRPDVEAEIRLQIGRSYEGLGEYQAAKEHFQVAAEFYRTLYGDQSSKYWEAMADMGLVEHDLGNYQSALEQLREVELQQVRLYGPDSLPVTITQARIATSEMMLGHLQAAVELQRKVVTNLASSDDLSLIDHHRAKLANLEHQLGNLQAAEEILQVTLPSMKHAIESGERQLGVDYIQALCTSGLVLDGQHRFAESEAVFRETVDLATKRLGADHPQRLMFVNFLAVALVKQGKLEEASELLNQVIPAMKAAIGTDHDITLAALNTLAGVQYSSGDYLAAERTLLERHEALTAKYAPVHPALVTSANNLSAIYLKLDRLDEAERWLLEAVTQADAALGKDHPDSIKAHADLALLYRRQDKLAEAEAEYVDAIERAERVLSPTHPNTLLFTSGLAMVYELSEQYEKAATSLKDLMEGYRARFGPDYEKIWDLKRRLGRVYSKQDKTDEAVILLEEVYQHRLDTLGAADEETLNVLSLLVGAEEQAGRLSSASMRLQDHLSMLDPGSDSWLRLQLKSCLGELLTGQGEFARAETLLLGVFDQQQQFSDRSKSEISDALLKTAQRLIEAYEGQQDTVNTDFWREQKELLGGDGA